MFNDELTIAAAVDSALESATVLEVIVVDDGSSDSGPEIVERLTNARVVLVRQVHAGACAARNRGAQVAVGGFLVFLDADDELMPDAVDRFAQAARFDSSEFIRAPMYVDRGGRLERHDPLKATPGCPYPRGPVAPGTFALAARLFVETGGYDRRLAYAENTELLLRINAHLERLHRPMSLLDEPSVVVHWLDQNRMSRYGSAQADAAELILRKHAEILAAERRVRRDYATIVGVARLADGHRLVATRFLAMALRAAPLSAKTWFQLLLVVTPAQLDRRITARRRRGDSSVEQP